MAKDTRYFAIEETDLLAFSSVDGMSLEEIEEFLNDGSDYFDKLIIIKGVVVPTKTTIKTVVSGDN